MYKKLFGWSNNKHKPIGILIVGLVIMILLIITQVKPEKLPPQERSWPIETIKVLPQTNKPEILLHGRVESRKMTTLRGAVTAYVEATPTLEGDRVVKDQLLIKLNPIDAELLLSQQEAQVNAVRAELMAEKNKNLSDMASLELEMELVDLVNKSVEREQQLSKRNLASQARVDEAELASAREKLGRTSRELAVKNHEARLNQLKANLDKASADRDLAAINLERTKIKAPFDGIISKKLVSVGDRISANEPILEMYATEVMEIRAQLSTNRLTEIHAALKQNTSLLGSVVEHPHILVKLDRLAGEIELNEGGVDALFVINGPKDQLRLGQAVKLNLNLPPVDGTIVVPSTALFDRGVSKIIYEVVTDHETHRLKAHDVSIVGMQFYDSQTYFIVIPPHPKPMKIMTTRLPLARDNLKVAPRD